MHIVCPHCTTSYAIGPATLGAAGRTVRCSRCKEVWLARPEDAAELAMAEASQHGADQAATGWDAPMRGEDDHGQDGPMVESPPISPVETADGADGATDGEWTVVARDDTHHARNVKPPSRLRRLFGRPALPGGSRARRSSSLAGHPRPAGVGRKSLTGLPATCAAMGALVVALMVWRADVVRLLPQTASFYNMLGLDVNLRGLAFKDVKISTETVDGKAVLVIEGAIVGQSSKPVELPRLRFSVRDAQGAEIYAWNAVLEQPVLKPGDTAWFKSRLASPPPEGRNIDVRFFSKRDLAGA